MAKVVCEIAQEAKSLGKDIVCERLDFSKKKGKQQKAKGKQGKEYNEMLHNLDTARYKELLESASFRNNLTLVEVNPANTSKIAKTVFCKKMKLSTHQGAAFVIARRGQNPRWGDGDYWRMKETEKLVGEEKHNTKTQKTSKQSFITKSDKKKSTNAVVVGAKKSPKNSKKAQGGSTA